MPIKQGLKDWAAGFKPMDTVGAMTQQVAARSGGTPTDSAAPPAYDNKAAGDPEKAELHEVAAEDYPEFHQFNGSTVSRGVVTDAQGRIFATAETGLKRTLKARHMQMIAFGGAIGTGLFVGTGSALATGGPASLLIDFALMGVLLTSVVLALGELATTFPVSGAFAAYSSRFIDPAWGASVAFNYFLQWYVTLPLELVAASIVINYWDPENKVATPGVWILVFLIALIIINAFGVRGYAEYEFVASMIKVLAVIGFIFAGIVIQTGGSPSGKYLGAETWHNGLAFQNGFKGFCSVFVTAAFAFAGSEIVGLTAAEAANPRKEVPKASKQVFYRIFLFYMLALFLITLIVPANTPELLGGSSSYDARASPFVIAIEIGKIRVLPSIINAVILVSVLSVGNTAVYGSSRTLCAMGQVGQAPKFFGYVDRHGRPTWAIAFTLAFGFLAFLIYSASQNDVFNWLLSLSGLSGLFTWLSISVCHIRFRKAWVQQGRTLEELPWQSPGGAWFSYVGAILNVTVLIAQFYKAGWPIGEADMSASERAVNFFESYLAFPFVIVSYIIYRFITKGAGWIPLHQIDITTGRKDPPSLEQLRLERAEAAARPFWAKVWDFFF